VITKQQKVLGGWILGFGVRGLVVFGMAECMRARRGGAAKLTRRFRGTNSSTLGRNRRWVPQIDQTKMKEEADLGLELHDDRVQLVPHDAPPRAFYSQVSGPSILKLGLLFSRAFYSHSGLLF